MAVTRTGWLVITGIVVFFAIPVAVVATNPSISPLTSGIRIAGLTGFVALAGAMIMTPFLPEIYRNFGRPFLRIHHLFAVAGIILVTLHPVLLAIRLMTVAGSSRHSVLCTSFLRWVAGWHSSSCMVHWPGSSSVRQFRPGGGYSTP